MEVESDRRQPILAKNSATKARKTSIPSIGNENKCFNFAGLTERQRAANQQNIPQYRTTTMPPSSLHNYTYQQVVEKMGQSLLYQLINLDFIFSQSAPVQIPSRHRINNNHLQLLIRKWTN
jgi:hypothetical protein